MRSELARDRPGPADRLRGHAAAVRRDLLRRRRGLRARQPGRRRARARRSRPGRGAARREPRRSSPPTATSTAGPTCSGGAPTSSSSRAPSTPPGSGCEAALELRRSLDDRRGVGLALSGLGRVETAAGDHDAAERHLAEARDLFRRAGDRWGLASTLWRTADLAFARGRARRRGGGAARGAGGAGRDAARALDRAHRRRPRRGGPAPRRRRAARPPASRRPASATPRGRRARASPRSTSGFGACKAPAKWAQRPGRRTPAQRVTKEAEMSQTRSPRCSGRRRCRSCARVCAERS